PTWAALVREWCVLEAVTSFQASGKALSAQGRPEAVSWWVQRARKNRAIPSGLDNPTNRENYYNSVVSWWIHVNPAWRTEGMTTPQDFAHLGLKQDRGDLDGLPTGLNGLTSVVACLWWWYRVAGNADGALLWTKMVEDVSWVFTE
ncbi:hypothetical protein C8R45DRAFT_782638, partial [Mycena sanguinolenta]